MRVGAKQCFVMKEQLLRGAKLSKAAAFNFYGLSFLCFAAMNLSAMFAHSLFPPAIYIEGVREIEASIPLPPQTFSYTTVTHIAHVLGELTALAVHWQLLLLSSCHQF